MNLPRPALCIHSSEQALKAQLLSRATKCGTSTTAMVDKIWDRLPLSPYSTIEGNPVFDFDDNVIEV